MRVCVAKRKDSKEDSCMLQRVRLVARASLRSVVGGG